MKLIFSAPSFDDLIRLLKAWRFWSVGALIGGLLGTGLFYVAPPPFRAHAVVLVDFNLETAWPQETDRQQFYYLERETRKLETLAYSDVVLEAVFRSNPSLNLSDLRDGRLILSQPGEGGWSFYVDDTDAVRAAALATSWATEFVKQAHGQLDAGGLNEFIEIELVRSAAMPTTRSVSSSVYIFVGAAVTLALGSILVLFFKRQE